MSTEESYLGILEQARKAIENHRTMSGEVENNFKLIASFWSVYLRAVHREELSASDVNMMMILLKIARQITGVDIVLNENLIDICGYAAQAAGV